jgi:hypothetical protein
VTGRFIFAAIFGTLLAFLAHGLGLTRGSVAQALGLGLLSAMGFATAAVFTRSRLARKKGQAPRMEEGETALLHGPLELAQGGGEAEAWAFLSDRRLTLNALDGSVAEIRLSQITELRPPRPGLTGAGEVSLVAEGKGLLTLKVPDAKRWHRALQGAIRK